MPTTNVYASSTDGQILSSSTTYADAREGTGTASLSANTTTSTQDVGQRLSGSTYSCWELFFRYDMIGGGIPAGSVATAASFKFTIRADGSTTDFTIEARDYDWGASLTTADWVAGSALSGKQLLASISTSGIANPFTMTNYVSGTDKLLDAVNAALAGDGILKILLCSDRHGAGTTPTGQENMRLYMNESATNVPELSVTYPDAGHPTMRRFGLSRQAVPRIHGMEGAYLF